MRKNVVYSRLLLLMGVMAACSSHENLDTGHDKQVRLGIDIDRGAQSRAATPIPPENYALRCIIEIWNSEGTSVLISTLTWKKSAAIRHLHGQIT